MKEILYVQLGPLSNHVGAHFWNAQESYFRYDEGVDVIGERQGGGSGYEEEEESKGKGMGNGDVDVDHDVSFREGVSWGRKAEPTYCPRVLIFDHKSNFGALGKYNELYGDPEEEEDGDEDEGEGVMGTWSGSIHDHRQPRIAKSGYLQRLDEGEEDDLELESDEEDLEITSAQPDQQKSGREDVRQVSSKGADNGSGTATTKKRPVPFSPQYWTDYNRMYFIPRSIHALPDTGDLSAGDSLSEGSQRKVYGFGRGRALFRRYEQEHELMETDFRRFVEECDQMQGINVSFDAYASSPFAGLTSALLESIRDDFAKTAILAVPVGVGIVEGGGLKGEQDPIALQRVMHDISTFLALEEHATGTIPLLNPSEVWRDGGDIVLGFEFSRKTTYERSAILSAHLESVTLPLRLKSSPVDLSSLLAQLNWTQSDPFAALGGFLGLAGAPTGNENANGVPLYDFSEGRKRTTAQIIAQHLVSRGQAPKDVTSYLTREGRYFTSYALPAYPVLSSSPPFMRRLARSLIGAPLKSPPKASTRPPTRMASLPLPLISSLHTDLSITAHRFASYATLLDSRIRNNTWRDLFGQSDDGAVGVDDVGGIGGAFGAEDGAGDGGMGTKDEVKEVVERLWKIGEGCGWSGEGEEGVNGGEDEVEEY